LAPQEPPSREGPRPPRPSALPGWKKDISGARRYGALGVLINNAGVTMSRRVLTADGVEAAFAANVLAPYLLIRGLLPALTQAASARVVNITGGVRRGGIDLDNLQGERSYVGLSFYNQTKLALMAMSHTYKVPG